MPTNEQEPTSKKPDGQQSQREIRRVSMPVVVFDQTHAVSVARNEKGALIVRILSGDTPLFSAAVTVDNSVHTITPGDKKPAQRPAARDKPEQPPAAEQQELLALPITIEGYPARPARYDNQKRHYSLTIGHHPNPEDRKEVIYYELVADDEKAAEFYALRLTDTRTPVHVTGTNRSYEVPRRGKPGEKKMIHLIEAESIERIVGRPDNTLVLNEKVKLADQQ